MEDYGVKVVGEYETFEYSIYFTKNGITISPLNDISTFNSNGTANMIVEIPRWTNYKLEISTKTSLNPIKHDIKNNKIRKVANVFPYHGYIWNYGFIPQTWESPMEVCNRTGLKGDNDPIDAIEIGSKTIKTGSVKEVKILGAMALIDDGELDWKVVCIDKDDANADKFNDIDDVRKHAPGLIEETIKWFEIYKIPDGKERNTFVFDGKAFGKQETIDIIKECHSSWEKCMKGEVKTGICLDNTTLRDTKSHIGNADVNIKETGCLFDIKDDDSVFV